MADRTLPVDIIMRRIMAELLPGDDDDDDDAPWHSREAHDTPPPIASGDYVRITRGAYQSEFGYVLRQNENTYSIVVDQYFPLDEEEKEQVPLSPHIIDCTLDDLELIREHGMVVNLAVEDFAHQSFTVHGGAA